MPQDPAAYHFTNNDDDAASRAKEWRGEDPFDEIPRALLSKDHIKEYVRVTGMLCPFQFDSDERLKAASYEAWPKRFIWWNEKGQKIIDEPSAEEYAANGYELKKNSITFMEIDTRIRLPNYIALRFNLSITHVHRGLLLGTGPLVDPGFAGDLLIPLHNLTAEPYRIRRGVIWFEFTKTSASAAPPKHFEDEKRNVSSEKYFERANRNNPIRSSIPVEMQLAQDAARKAERDARRAANLNKIFVGGGLLAIIATALGLLSYIVSTEQVITGLIGSAMDKASQSSADSKKALDLTNETRTQLENGESRRANDAITELRQQVEELRRRVDALQSNTRAR